MTIYCTRDSVCMADDVVDNSRDISFANDATVSDIIPIIKENRFLASILGNDVLWKCSSKDNKYFLEYYTKSDKIVFNIPKNTSLSEVCGDDLQLHFSYFSHY